MVPAIGERTSSRAEVVSRPCERGARLVGCLARLRELLGARAFLQFPQVSLGFQQRCLGGLRDRRLPIGFRFADQASRHEVQQSVAFAYGIVTLHPGRIATCNRGADGGAARAVLEFLDARLSPGEFRAGGVEPGSRKLAVLHHDDISDLHGRAFGERQ